MMFLVMLEVDGYIRYRVPSLTSAVVADDYQILVIEEPATISVSFTLAAGVTLDALRVYDLPSALKKQATLASSLEVSKKIVKAMPLLKNTVTRTTRNHKGGFHAAWRSPHPNLHGALPESHSDRSKDEKGQKRWRPDIQICPKLGQCHHMLGSCGDRCLQLPTKHA